MACCVRGYHEYKNIEAAATREVLVCGRWCAVVGKNFVVKLYSCKIFSYVFCVRKYFCNEKKRITVLADLAALAALCHFIPRSENWHVRCDYLMHSDSSSNLSS